MTTTAVTNMTHEEWLAEAERRFGKDPADWKFVCPVCENVAAARDFFPFFDEKGQAAQAATNECIGRHVKPRRGAFDQSKGEPDKPCNYAGYGLIRLSPIRVIFEGEEVHSFAFADEGSNG